MTEHAFRRLALALRDVIEGAHMRHPDFRASGRIFATLHGDGEHGMVKLTPDQQRRLIREHPDAFAPESGAWGRQGCTRVTLAAVDEETAGDALTLAWQNAVAAKRATKRKPVRRRK